MRSVTALHLTCMPSGTDPDAGVAVPDTSVENAGEGASDMEYLKSRMKDSFDDDDDDRESGDCASEASGSEQYACGLEPV